MPNYTKKVQIPGKSSQELYDVVAGDIERVLGKLSLGGSAEVEKDPATRCIHIKSSMFTGTLTCLDSAMELEAKLSFLAAPFKSKIDETISRWLAKQFNLDHLP